MRKHLGVVTGLFLLPSVGYADAPPFDRPGISFSPAVLAPGAFDWEQGLPDVQRDYTGGVRSTSYSADTTFRLGLAQNFEAQVTGSLWNRLDVRIDAVTSRMEGAGDKDSRSSGHQLSRSTMFRSPYWVASPLTRGLRHSPTDAVSIR
jgi:hypothetical protein